MTENNPATDKKHVEEMLKRSQHLRLNLYIERKLGFEIHKRRAKERGGCNLCGFFEGYSDEQLKFMQEAFALAYCSDSKTLYEESNTNALLIHTFFEQMRREIEFDFDILTEGEKEG